MLHSSTVVRASTISGLGLFAVADIDEGEVIWRDEPGEPRFSIDEIQRWPTDKQRRFHRYSYQIDERWYAGNENGTPFDASYLMNHSCDPNTWFTDDRTGVARRRIGAGEEITYDYSTSEVHEEWSMSCRCNSRLCRGTIRGTDYRTQIELQQRYGSRVMSHVLRQICIRGAGAHLPGDRLVNPPVLWARQRQPRT